jgi:hypothetical protein
MADNESPTNQQLVDNKQINDDGIVEKASPLSLDIPDKDLTDIIDKRIKDSRKFFKDKYKLYERREKNEKFLFGRQINEDDLKKYEAKYLDNVIYETEASIKPLAMSRLPDMIVTPGNNTEESKTIAKDVSKVIDTDIKKRNTRTVLGVAFKHLPAYFTGVIKVKWDKELDDFIFEVVHPDFIDLDQTCPINDADKMKWIAQTIPITVEECVLKFPKKKDELIKKLRDQGVITNKDGEPEKSEMATEIKIKEVWFDWYKEKKGKDKEGKQEYEKITAVLWKYDTVVLEKMKNPNFDYEGEKKYFMLEDPSDESTKREISEEEIMMAVMTGQTPQGISEEMVYRNYFSRPRKPYFFMGYDQWHKIAYDETSRIEQNTRNQENLDKRGKSILDKLAQRIKHIFSKESGLKADDIENMDLDDPKQDLLVDGDVSKVHGEIRPEQPSAQEFKDLNDTRERMYGVAGATAVRGELQSDVATNNQIARENNFTRADDLVEDTINAACEWIADWDLHMIKLRYTENHFRKILGAKGEITFVKVCHDMIEDGMEVMIKASGTDKLKAQRNALELAKMQMIDPVSLFEDLGLPDPVGRAERLLTFQAMPANYMAQYILNKGGSAQALAMNLAAQPPTPPVASVAPAPTGGAAPTIPSPQNTSGVPAIPTGPPAGSPRMM